MTFEIDDANNGLELLRSSEVTFEEVSVKGELLTVKLSKSSIPSVNKLFVEKGLSVYGINAAKATLEDRFLEITNKKGEEAKR